MYIWFILKVKEGLGKHYWSFPSALWSHSVPSITNDLLGWLITFCTRSKVWTCFAAWHLAFTELSVPWLTQHIWCDLWAFGARNSTNVQSVSKCGMLSHNESQVSRSFNSATQAGDSPLVSNQIIIKVKCRKPYFPFPCSSIFMSY